MPISASAVVQHLVALIKYAVVLVGVYANRRQGRMRIDVVMNLV